MITEKVELLKITPAQNKYLYNETAQVISDKVYLGINANENEWIEISEDEKREIEKKLNEELEGL